MKLRSFVLGALAVVLGLPLLAAGAAIALVDPKDIADRAARAFSERTGRTLTVRGTSSLALFPSPGARVEQVMLANPDGFSGPAFATAAAIDARTTWAGALRGEIRIESLEIDGLALNLERRADGASNWDALIAGAPDASAEAPAISLEHLKVTGARISYSHGRGGRVLSVRDLELGVTPLALGRPLAAKLSAAVEGPWMSGTADLEGTIALAWAPGGTGGEIERLNASFELAEPKARMEIEFRPRPAPFLGLEIDAGEVALDPLIALGELFRGAAADEAPPGAGLRVPALAGLALLARLRAGALTARGWRLDDVDLGVKLENSLLTIAPLAVNVAEGRHEGRLTLNLAANPVELSARSTLSEWRLDRLMADTGIGLPVPLGAAASALDIELDAGIAPDGARVTVSRAAAAGNVALAGGPPALPVRLELNGTADPIARALSVARISLEAGGLSLAGTLEASIDGGAPRAGGQLDVEVPDLRALAAQTGLALPPTSSAQSLGAAGLSARFKLADRLLALDPATLRLDDSTASGWVRLDFTGPPAFEFAFDVDRVDASRYLPPPGQEDANAPGPLSLAALRALDANGTVTITELDTPGGTLQGVTLRVESNAQENDGDAGR